MKAPEDRTAKHDWVWYVKRFATGFAALIFSAAGLSGLVVAGQTMADVETLKAQAQKNEKVAERVVKIEATVGAIQEEQKRQRDDAKDQAKKVDDKLNTIERLLIDRLPRP